MIVLVTFLSLEGEMAYFGSQNHTLQPVISCTASEPVERLHTVGEGACVRSIKKGGDKEIWIPNALHDMLLIM